MKKIIIVIALLISAKENLFAQTSNTEKTFELPANNIKRKFLISLDKGDKMQIELTDISDIKYLRNVDSLVKMFINDVKALKDSLLIQDELISRRIDYIIDTSSRKKIRILKFPQTGSSFLVDKSDIALLKLEQDTITITGVVATQSTGIFFRKQTELHYYRVSFFLNNLEDLSAYRDGRLNEKINSLKKNVSTNWSEKGGITHLKKDPSITAATAGGHIGGGDFLSLRFSVDAQNYRNYFVPSATLGFAIVTNNNLIRREFSIVSEQHFLFARKDSTNKPETFRNSFLTLSYGRTALKNIDSKFSSSLYPFISVGYLIKRRGDFYDKNTFKVGVGKISLFGGTTKIEPVFYFNNFFKGVTPSFRITQSF